MFFSPRIRLKPLSQLCHRLAIATNAGLEDRRIWRDEAQRGSRAQQRCASAIADELVAGNSITDALPRTGEFFPRLFCSMVSVGETSGQLGRTYKRLAQHYNKTLAARRAFQSRLTWPMLQLVLALFIIGLLIWIMGILPANNTAAGQQIDILGFGWVGNSGLFKYINLLIVVGIVILLLVETARRGAMWTRPIQRMLVKLPAVGHAFKTLALARFTWALQLVLDTPMDLRRALPLALEATGNDYYAQHGRAVAKSIQQGQSLHTALAMTGVFPTELLDQIAVGEESGRLVETMEHQSADYQERAGMAISLLAQFAGYAVWLMVACFIIFLIIRIFSFYTQQLNSLL